MFRKGDRVTVTNPNPGNARYRGIPGFYAEEFSPAR